jgi:hypothetical protein
MHITVEFADATRRGGDAERDLVQDLERESRRSRSKVISREPGPWHACTRNMGARIAPQFSRRDQYFSNTRSKLRQGRQGAPWNLPVGIISPP